VRWPKAARPLWSMSTNMPSRSPRGGWSSWTRRGMIRQRYRDGCRGANVVVFTTGRGSCFGCKPTPSIKVATNTPMFERMADDMDINAGEILHGRPLAEVGQEIFDEILAVASGKRTKSEQHGIGDEEFIPWTVGPML
jgi:altronate dehydratase